jgi:hypothetical protein
LSRRASAARIAARVLLLVHLLLAGCGVCLLAWIAVATAAGRRAAAGVRIATWLQIGTFAALAMSCVSLVAVGLRERALWGFFLLIAVPLVLVDLWASVRLALHERCGRRGWPRWGTRPATAGGSRADRPT